MTHYQDSNRTDAPTPVWGSQAPHPETCVYVSNKGGFDVDGAIVYAGAKARVPMVYLHEGSMSKDNIKAAEDSIEDKLRYFNPDVDVLMVAGRALVNMLVGSAIQGLFPGRRIQLVTWDARSRTYELSHWDVAPLE